MLVEVFSGVGDSGTIAFTLDDPDALSPDDLLLGIGSPDFPFRLVTRNEAKVSFAWSSDVEPLFSFEGNRCSFWKRPGWQTAVALLILHRIYRLRRDAIFFHAATIDLGGRGLMIIGSKGMGKSTTALALASRGHVLLGDETACYVPATGGSSRSAGLSASSPVRAAVPSTKRCFECAASARRASCGSKPT